MPGDAPPRPDESGGDLLEARLFGYVILREFFLAEPSRRQVQCIAGDGVIGAFPFPAESEAIRVGIGEVLAAMDPAGGLDDAVLEQLRRDYTRLFVGPHRLLAPPWESAYRTEERLIFQEHTLEVRQAYLEYRLRPAGDTREADDHIGLELDFMARLCDRALEHRRRGESRLLREVLADQRRFLEQHLLVWAPDFARDVIATAETEYFRGAGRVLAGFMELEPRLVGELLELHAT